MPLPSSAVYTGFLWKGSAGVRMRRVLALLAVVLLPAAQATLTLSAQLPSDELQPGTGVALGSAVVALDCVQALLRTHGIATSVAVSLAATGPPLVTVATDPMVDLPLAPCQAGAATTQATTPFSASVGAGAPAHLGVAFNLTADLPADPTAAVAAPRETQSAKLSVHAKPLLLVTVTSPQAVHLTQRNQTFAFHLANQGNVGARVEATLVFSTPLASAAPAAVELGNPVLPGSGPAERDLEITIDAPDNGKAPEFTAKATFQVRPLDGGPAGPPIEATLFFRNEVPPPKSSPAPPVAALGLVLLGVAAARRRA